MKNQNTVDYIGYLGELFGQLDKYLISDLKTLIDEIPERPQGGVGYPALHSILASMELLGLILSGRETTNAFKFYWEKYLMRLYPKQYNVPKLVDIFYSVIRNGTAHLFIVKSGISISKNGNNHLVPVIFGGQRYLNIDLKILRADFIATYDQIKKEVLHDPLTEGLKKGCENLYSQMIVARDKVDSFFNTGPGYGPEIGQMSVRDMGKGWTGPSMPIVGKSTSGTITNPFK